MAGSTRSDARSQGVGDGHFHKQVAAVRIPLLTTSRTGALNRLESEIRPHRRQSAPSVLQLRRPPLCDRRVGVVSYAELVHVYARPVDLPRQDLASTSPTSSSTAQQRQTFASLLVTPPRAPPRQPALAGLSKDVSAPAGIGGTPRRTFSRAIRGGPSTVAEDRCPEPETGGT